MSFQAFPSKKQSETAPGIKRRPEKLDRRWLKDGCVGRQAMMTKQSGDADWPRH